MPVLSTGVALPLLGHASHDELLDVCRRAASGARQRRRPVLASWAGRLRHADPIALWRHGRTRTDRSLLWQSAWDRGSLVALGTAHDLTGYGDSRVAAVRRAWEGLVRDAVVEDHRGERLPTGQGPLLVGGFSFATAAPFAEPSFAEPSYAGSSFTAASFAASGPESRLVPLPEALMWVPALQVRAGADPTALAELRLNAVVHPEDDPEQIAEALVHLAERCLPQDAPATGHDTPGPAADGPPVLREQPPAEAWQDLVRRAVRRIEAGAFEKVVLAREVRVSRAAPFDVPAALRRLRRTHPDATVFAVGHGARTFIGATPEYLVTLSGRTVRTLGLAGTAPRGSTPEEDARLERELTDSARLRHEHDVVVRMLRDALRGSCTRLEVAPVPGVVKLANVQHLSTPIEGQLADSAAGILELVERLHPTPALGGHPREPSLDWLTRNEGIDRGWYAAPVGWTDASGQGEFGVAIRSALVGSDTATLYAGCGIVAGSDPQEEYAETCAKLRPMLHALGID